jgi:hypothetical protein
MWIWSAGFWADSQVPFGLDANNGTVTEPAWREKPNWYLVATDDKMIPPPAQRQMSNRAGSTGRRGPGKSRDLRLESPRGGGVDRAGGGRRQFGRLVGAAERRAGPDCPPGPKPMPTLQRDRGNVIGWRQASVCAAVIFPVHASSLLARFTGTNSAHRAYSPIGLRALGIVNTLP